MTRTRQPTRGITVDRPLVASQPVRRATAAFLTQSSAVPPDDDQKGEEEDGTSLIRVLLNSPENLSMGEVGRLLADLQAGVRASAGATGEPPPRGSVRVTGFTSSSLEFIVEVVGWGLPHARAVADVVVEIAKLILAERGVAVSAPGSAYVIYDVVRRIIERRRRAIRQGIAQLQEEEDEEARRERQRQLEARELSRELRLPEPVVLRSIRAHDSLQRSLETIKKSGGGLIESIPSAKIVRFDEHGRMIEEPQEENEPPPTSNARNS